MNTIQVEIKGFRLYCENDQHEMYDFFVPRQYYRMPRKDAYELIPETHKLLDIKRDRETIYVQYDALMEISKQN